MTDRRPMGWGVAAAAGRALRRVCWRRVAWKGMAPPVCAGEAGVALARFRPGRRNGDIAITLVLCLACGLAVDASSWLTGLPGGLCAGIGIASLSIGGWRAGRLLCFELPLLSHSWELGAPWLPYWDDLQPRLEQHAWLREWLADNDAAMETWRPGDFERLVAACMPIDVAPMGPAPLGNSAVAQASFEAQCMRIRALQDGRRRRDSLIENARGDNDRRRARA